jgi:hypothetical protein
VQTHEVNRDDEITLLIHEVNKDDEITLLMKIM